MSALYLDEALTAAEPGEVLVLSGPEARHAGTVAKVRVDDPILVSNGRGLLIDAVVTEIAKETLHFRVSEAVQHSLPYPSLTLVQSLAKGGRDELAIQTATELGVHRVIPWQSDRSIVRWNAEKQVKNQQRWQSIVQEAAKQSMNPWVPEVQGMQTTAQLVTDTPTGVCIVLEPNAKTSLVEWLPERLQESAIDRLNLFVGPEGGLTERELEQLSDQGAQLLRMGDLVLRSSTAGPTALALINALTGRW